MDVQKVNTILVSGNAQLPRATTAYETVRMMTVVLEIEWESERIVNADFSLYSKVSVRFLRKLTVDYCLKQGLDPLTEVIQERFQVFSQGAVIRALQAAYERYRLSRQKRLGESPGPPKKQAE